MERLTSAAIFTSGFPRHPKASPDGYLLLPNFSCHLPLATGAGGPADVWGTSSIVSFNVAIVARPTPLSEPSGVEDGPDAEEGSPLVGERSISALDVFF